MRQKPEALSVAAEKTVRDIKRATRRHFSAEDKIRIVIACLRGEAAFTTPLLETNNRYPQDTHKRGYGS